jgi:glycogen debranching enzyme
VIERTGAFIKEESGQLPHHFEGVKPYYVALSGETQTGPNVFWVKTALRYAAVTGDFEWLSSYMPTLRNASSFVFDLIDPTTNLIFAPGSLMIDVFIRNNYTTDSNAMVVGLLRDFAGAERLVGDSNRAAELEDTAVKVSAAINKNLWAAEAAGADHYITQLNLDGSTRDFVDYGTQWECIVG